MKNKAVGAFFLLLIMLVFHGCSNNLSYQDSIQYKITDVYYDSLDMINKNEKVMIIELDGFGWNVYEYGKKNNLLPYISSLKADKALASYPSVSQVGLASILTGKEPKENGIKSREDKELLVPDIFSEVDRLDKKSAYVEGNIKLINTSLDPILSVQRGDDETTDPQVFENAKKEIQKKPDLLYVHFHGIDDDVTSYGLGSKEVKKRLVYSDKIVSELVSSWEGRIIIIADHGLHESDNGEETPWTHGSDREEDMVVPYIKK